MSESVQMPALGESVTEGTVTQWLKSVGDEVEVDEPLLEVSTDKVDTEIPSPVAGVLEKILVEEDETVEVGAELAVIGSGEGASGGDDAEEGASDDEGASEEESPADAGSDEDEAPAAEEEPEPEPEPEADDKGGESDSAPKSQDSGGGGERTAVNLPELGESVTEGTVTQWLKSVGDEVEVDEPLLEISTDKVDTEIPSPVAGTLLEIVVEEDETVEVGAALAYVGSGDAGSDSGAEAPSESAEQPSEPEQDEKPSKPEQGVDASGGSDAAEAEGEETPETGQAQIPEDVEPEPEKSEPEPETPEPAKSEPAPKQEDAPTADSGDEPVAYVTPLVRKLAADKGVDLADVSGSGVGGRIRKQDVLDAAEAAAKAAQAKEEEPKEAPAEKKAEPSAAGEVSPLRGTREKMSRLRKIVAKRMVESLQVSAQLTTVVEVDVTRVARLRDKAKAEFQRREGVKLTYLPFFTLAATEALKTYPNLNASIEGEEIVYHGAENVGIAVDTERGLVVPVVKDAGDLNIAGIARSIADLADRTRANKITPDELSGGTFTITNTGSGGALFDTPILLQPQVGIMGIGTIVKRPVVDVIDGAEVIAVRSMVYLSLSYDHRLVDGADAGRFLTAVKNRLEEGAFEAALGL
ncbi:2-oxoglutarate dehydrogenase, E2 component, dihydrolipoamide succinyltransferase [Pseudactinotalea sp. Z1732]|uniref:2-oxoglutarate dehydrogenase, E2 component, dihydrolipoamide succinyltransferase n=1 Tax=Micrococcales TaxID=85006 RepID=UPI003C7EA29B